MNESEQANEQAHAAHRLPAEQEPARSELILKRLLAAHETWFDVRRDVAVGGRTFPGFAEFHSHGEQYVLSKRAKLWEVDSHEYILFDIVEHLEKNAFQDAVSFMKTEALKLVKPEPNHMSSNLSLIIIAHTVEQGVDALVRRTRFRKNFAWGIRGWSDLRIAVVDLSGASNGRVMTNAAGKPLRATIEANLTL